MTEGPWHLRRAVADDEAALAACLESAYAAHARRLPDLPPMAEGLAREIAEREVWLAEAGQRVLGALVLAPQPAFLLLANIAVDPAARGGGLGRRLFDLAETRCRALGLDELRLTTHAGLTEVLDLYARSGWREVSRDGGRVRLAKRLPAS